MSGRGGFGGGGLGTLILMQGQIFEVLAVGDLTNRGSELSAHLYFAAASRTTLNMHGAHPAARFSRGQQLALADGNW